MRWGDVPCTVYQHQRRYRKPSSDVSLQNSKPKTLWPPPATNSQVCAPSMLLVPVRYHPFPPCPPPPPPPSPPDPPSPLQSPSAPQSHFSLYYDISGVLAPDKHVVYEQESFQELSTTGYPLLLQSSSLRRSSVACRRVRPCHLTRQRVRSSTRPPALTPPPPSCPPSRPQPVHTPSASPATPPPSSAAAPTPFS